MTSVFSAHMNKVWSHRYEGTILTRNIAGGTPSDPKIAEGWLKTKLTDKKDKDDLIRDMVAEVMVERGITVDEATTEVDMLKHLNGFKKNDTGLYIESRQLKAAIKEGASVARATDNLKDRWGATRKGCLGFVAEHIMVVEDLLQLYRLDADGNKVHLTEPDDVLTSFPKNPRTNQTGIQHTEILREAFFDFTVISDYEFTDAEWATLWLTSEQQGVGANRSQGFGRYEVVRWDRVKAS
jgi:hypothetical protein